MPEVHLPHLDEDEHDHAASPGVAPHSRGKTLGKLALEVLLISAGVFLGLAGEQWRETRREHEQARITLENFRREVQINREQVAKVKDYHVQLRGILQTYLGEPGPKTLKTFRGRGVNGFQTVTFRHSAWDLAVATGALAHVEPLLAFAISDVYTDQQQYQVIENTMMNSAYGPTSFTSDLEGFLTSVAIIYMADVIETEPRLLKEYDALLPRLENATH